MGRNVAGKLFLSAPYINYCTATGPLAPYPERLYIGIRGFWTTAAIHSKRLVPNPKSFSAAPAMKEMMVDMMAEKRSSMMSVQLDQQTITVSDIILPPKFDLIIAEPPSQCVSMRRFRTEASRLAHKAGERRWE